jgi:hypothetical protein
VLARVVLPLDGRALPLYVDGDAPDTPTSADVLDRRRVRVPAGRRVSFATWFAAFPAGWWARWTDVRAVELDVELTGPGTVTLLRSDPSGRVHPLPGRRAALDDPAGGWVWFEVQAGDEDVVVERADWRAAREGSHAGAGTATPTLGGTATLAMTTFDRPASALAVLDRLADEPAALAVVDEVVVVDQGRRRVRDEADFERVQRRLGGRLRLVEQPNLGAPAASPAACSRRSRPAGAATSSSWTTTSRSSPSRCCGPSPSPTAAARRPSSPARCSTWTPRPCSTPRASGSTASASCGRPSRPARATPTWPGTACARRRGCTCGSTSSSAAGGRA